MSNPRVLNKYKDKPTPNTVNIMRPSKWGNKFSHMKGTLAEFKVETRDEAVDKYEKSLTPEFILIIKDELKGKNLLCCCAPLRCHGDILLRIANE